MSPFRAALTILIAVAGCGAGADNASNTQDWQEFTLGTMPLYYAQEDELRYLVRVPRRHIDEALLPDEMLFDDRNRIIANNVRIAVYYPSLAPAPARARAPTAGPDREVVRLQVGNMTEAGIRRSLDGSWLNHFSIYTINLADAFGLHARGSSSPYDDDRVYYRMSPEMDVRIECHSNPMRRDAGCVMIAKRPGEPYLQTGFENDELPRWAERLSRLQTLFRAVGKAPLGGANRPGGN